MHLKFLFESSQAEPSKDLFFDARNFPPKSYRSKEKPVAMVEFLCLCLGPGQMNEQKSL